MTDLLFAGILTTLNVLAGTAIWLAGRVSGGNSWRKHFNSLRAEYADLQAVMEELLASHKRLRSREGMRELRERRGAGSQTETPWTQNSRVAARRALGVADNPITATLENLAGKYAPAGRDRPPTDGARQK